MQEGAFPECGPEFQEELLVLQSIYDSELQIKRKDDGGISLQLKLCPSPPTYLRASVTLHIPTAVRTPAVRFIEWPLQTHTASRISLHSHHRQNATSSVRITCSALALFSLTREQVEAAS